MVVIHESFYLNLMKIKVNKCFVYECDNFNKTIACLVCLQLQFTNINVTLMDLKKYINENKPPYDIEKNTKCVIE